MMGWIPLALLFARAFAHLLGELAFCIEISQFLRQRKCCIATFLQPIGPDSQTRER
jgi:hypothetical protein